MNQFQKNVILKHPNICMDDFCDYTQRTDQKIENMGLPKNKCCINNYFNDAGVLTKHYQREYCLKNCGLKCI